MLFFLVLFLFVSPCFLEGGIAVNSRTTLLFGAKPGDQMKSPIVLSNPTDKTEEVKIYCMDYSFSAGGSFSFNPPGYSSKSCCPWITLPQTHLTLPPKTGAEMKFSLSVPNDMSLEGTYWGIIFVEPVVAPLSEGKVYQTIQSVVRYGIQVIVEIGTSGTYSVKVLKHEIFKNGEKKLLQFDVENQGSRFVQLNPSLDIFTKEGGKIEELKATKLLVLPACSVRFSFDVSQVEPGDYEGFLLLDHSEEAIFGGQYSFTIPKPLSEEEKLRVLLETFEPEEENLRALLQKIEPQSERPGPPLEKLIVDSGLVRF